MQLICPHCHKKIEVNSSTYYSRHKTEILEKYKIKKTDPDFMAKRRAISLKSYHKRKQECQNQ